MRKVIAAAVAAAFAVASFGSFAAGAASAEPKSGTAVVAHKAKQSVTHHVKAKKKAARHAKKTHKA